MLIYVVSQKQVDKSGIAWRTPECGANLWFNNWRWGWQAASTR